MIYNKTAFDALDLDVPETWQDIIDASTALRNYGAQFNNINDVVPAVYDSPNNAFITFIKQFQGAYTSLNYDDMTGECLWADDTNTLSAMNYLKTNKNSMTIPSFWDQSYGSSPFMQQKTFIIISSSSDIRYNIPPIDQISGLHIFEIGVAPIPHYSELTDSNAVLQIGTDLALIDTGTAQQQLASWLFIKYMTSTEITTDWAVNTGNLPVRTSAYESAIYQEFLNNPTPTQVNNSLVANAAYQQLDDMFFSAAFIRSHSAWLHVGVALERIMQGDGEIQESLDDAVLS
jgi:multiple sugar transport system substrate-binding protein